MIRLSKRQRDEADRLPGIELVVPYPVALCPPALGVDVEIDATPAEYAAAERTIDLPPARADRRYPRGPPAAAAMPDSSRPADALASRHSPREERRSPAEAVNHAATRPLRGSRNSAHATFRYSPMFAHLAKASRSARLRSKTIT